MSAAEKLACEWEARHDAAARSRLLDPAAALQRYLNHTPTDEGLRHQAKSPHPVRVAALRAGTTAGRLRERTPARCLLAALGRGLPLTAEFRRLAPPPL